MTPAETASAGSRRAGAERRPRRNNGDYRTTLIYADYEPGDDESAMVDDAFS